MLDDGLVSLQQGKERRQTPDDITPKQKAYFPHHPSSIMFHRAALSLTTFIALAILAKDTKAFIPLWTQLPIGVKPLSPSAATGVNVVVVVPASSTALESTIAGNAEARSTSNKAVTKPISEKEVRALFSLWNDALATGDSRIVAKRYAMDPILLATVSDVPRTDFDSIKDYFDNFLKLKPQGIILEGKIRIGPTWAQDAGIYEFTMGAKGGAKVKARYSFVYVYENNEWKISHHHSSTMPEGKANIEEEQVKNLFHLWNDALDTCTCFLGGRRSLFSWSQWSQDCPS